MAHIIPDGHAPSGWQCPACRHVYGPQVAECPRCPEAPPAPLFPFPGAVRLPSEYGAIPDLPPRRPMCKCSLVPVPCPPSREGGMCGCGESDEDHARNRCPDCHMPLTMHHDPMLLPASGTDDSPVEITATGTRELP
jgi:hypothetical protein